MAYGLGEAGSDALVAQIRSKIVSRWLPIGPTGFDAAKGIVNPNTSTGGVTNSVTVRGPTLQYSGTSFGGLQTTLAATRKVTLVLAGGPTGGGGRFLANADLEILVGGSTSFDIYISGSLRFSASWPAAAKRGLVLSMDLSSASNVPVIYVDGNKATMTPTGTPGTPTLSGVFMLFNHHAGLDRQGLAECAGAVVLNDVFNESLQREWSNNPLRAFAPLNDDVFYTLATGGTTVAVPAGALTLTGYAPTVTAGGTASTSVPAGAVTLTAYAPTVTAGGTASTSVPLGTVTLTGYAPTVTVGGAASIDVPLGTVALTGYAPTVTTGGQAQIDVPLGTVTLTGYVPTVTTTEHVYIAVPTAAMTLAAYAPTVTTSGTPDTWTPVSASTGTWTPASAAGGTWTPQ